MWLYNNSLVDTHDTPSRVGAGVLPKEELQAGDGSHNVAGWAAFPQD